eukprot:9498419-Pyramimonas_sp.AAC.1
MYTYGVTLAEPRAGASLRGFGRRNTCKERASGGREPYTTQQRRPLSFSTSLLSSKISLREKVTKLTKRNPQKVTAGVSGIPVLLQDVEQRWHSHRRAP